MSFLFEAEKTRPSRKDPRMGWVSISNTPAMTPNPESLGYYASIASSDGHFPRQIFNWRRANPASVTETTLPLCHPRQFNPFLPKVSTVPTDRVRNEESSFEPKNKNRVSRGEASRGPSSHINLSHLDTLINFISPWVIWVVGWEWDEDGRKTLFLIYSSWDGVISATWGDGVDKMVGMDDILSVSTLTSGQRRERSLSGVNSQLESLD